MKAALTFDSRLNTFISQQGQDTFYYNQEWLALISRLYGYTPIALTTAGSDGQYTGFLPLCSLQSPLTGRRLVALPFSDYAPLLATDEGSANELIEQAIHLARKQRAKYLEFRTGVNPVLAEHPGLMESNLYVSWLLPLSTDTKAVWSGLRKPVQRQIKKAQGNGVKVRFAQKPEDIRHFYHLHLQTRSKKHGMPAQPFQFFSGLWNAFAASGNMQLLLAEYEGNVIASMILLASGSTLRYAYGASDESYLNLAPNNLLMWEAITWGCTHGYQTLDLGRTSCDNEGLMEFKRRWGATQQPLPYYYYPRTAGLAATSEKSWKFRLLTTCWKKLPLQVAGPLGGRLYKHLG
ncbi:MAG TPA: GNAT family N-acetyltransferase [Ktedonobacteraceae bacterium]|nr:GNAT family N-acetyltransferase [Ktedonobacteraceae bacterium]